MRLLPVLCLLPLLALPAQAQTAPGAQVAPTAAAVPPVASAPAAAPAPHHRMSWQQRFAQANTTHDGHLTLEQAKEGYRTIARHFNEIDTGKKGFVTLDDIAAWHKLQRAMRHSNHDANDDTLRLRPAMQRGAPALQAPPFTPPSTSDASGVQQRHGT